MALLTTAAALTVWSYRTLNELIDARSEPSLAVVELDSESATIVANTGRREVQLLYIELLYEASLAKGDSSVPVSWNTNIAFHRSMAVGHITEELRGVDEAHKTVEFVSGKHLAGTETGTWEMLVEKAIYETPRAEGCLDFVFILPGSARVEGASDLAMRSRQSQSLPKYLDGVKAEFVFLVDGAERRQAIEGVKGVISRDLREQCESYLGETTDLRKES